MDNCDELNIYGHKIEDAKQIATLLIGVMERFTNDDTNYIKLEDETDLLIIDGVVHLTTAEIAAVKKYLSLFNRKE